MYAIVNYVDGSGVTVAHTREEQVDADNLGVEIAVEQEKDPDDVERPRESFRAEVAKALGEYGVYNGNGWSVAVIKVTTTGAALSAVEAPSRPAHGYSHLVLLERSPDPDSPPPQCPNRVMSDGGLYWRVLRCNTAGGGRDATATQGEGVTQDGSGP